jgi:hypothetical protein
MKRGFLKVLFSITVLALAVIFITAEILLLPVLFTLGPRPDGHYRGNPAIGLLGGIIVVFIGLKLADRVPSALFRRARLTEERWSLFQMAVWPPGPSRVIARWHVPPSKVIATR